jgi:hypothetical protein
VAGFGAGALKLPAGQVNSYKEAMPLPKLLPLILLIASSPLLAQDAGDFAKGTRTFEFTGGYNIPIKNHQERYILGTPALGCYLWDNFSINLGLDGMYIYEPGSDAIGGGANILLRWHFLHLDRLSLYGDVGGGLVELDRDAPPSGTRFDFTGRAGFGATFRLKQDLYLLGGVRYFHMSNGMIWGIDRNPSFDGTQFYLGLMFSF